MRFVDLKDYMPGGSVHTAMNLGVHSVSLLKPGNDTASNAASYKSLYTTVDTYAQMAAGMHFVGGTSDDVLQKRFAKMKKPEFEIGADFSNGKYYEAFRSQSALKEYGAESLMDVLILCSQKQKAFDFATRPFAVEDMAQENPIADLDGIFGRSGGKPIAINRAYIGACIERTYLKTFGVRLGAYALAPEVTETITKSATPTGWPVIAGRLAFRA